MCILVCVCMYVYMCVCVSVCMWYVCGVCVCAHVCVCVCVCVCVWCVCMCLFVCVCVCGVCVCFVSGLLSSVQFYMRVYLNVTPLESVSCAYIFRKIPFLFCFPNSYCAVFSSLLPAALDSL